ncbi:unnamed protein product [Darwinula stevensoni]|uniref:Uncharacterized protein n=1 Tax=Darwinula stevensoni TaxID=69355 RepID=A0A7R9FQN4_9CRUS|nr:unnamed protein product [Darwinula stevensoni]CAG0900113.1 unnamed protein product [Darwinula stevensoni]
MSEENDASSSTSNDTEESDNEEDKKREENRKKRWAEQRMQMLEEQKKTREGLVAREQHRKTLMEEWKKMRAREEKMQQMMTDDLMKNLEAFDCLICMDNIPEGEGVCLKECRHNFCKNCLQGTINSTETPEVTCPHADDSGPCSVHLQQREIRALLNKNDYERHLDRSLRYIEGSAGNTFHCRKEDCPGWCFYEPGINRFPCPCCKSVNCINCRVIHEGKTCKEYQDYLTREAEKNDELKQSLNQLKVIMTASSASFFCGT